MSVEQVRSYLKSFAKDQDIIETEQSSATVALAAQALGTEPQRIAKSLAFQGETGVILVVHKRGLPQLITRSLMRSSEERQRCLDSRKRLSL